MTEPVAIQFVKKITSKVLLLPMISIASSATNETKKLYSVCGVIEGEKKKNSDSGYIVELKGLFEAKNHITNEYFYSNCLILPSEYINNTLNGILKKSFIGEEFSMTCYFSKADDFMRGAVEFIYETHVDFKPIDKLKGLRDWFNYPEDEEKTEEEIEEEKQKKEFCENLENDLKRKGYVKPVVSLSDGVFSDEYKISQLSDEVIEAEDNIQRDIKKRKITKK